MLKYVDTKVTFSEVPNEISLCINFSNCHIKCKGCHSDYLTQDIGEIMDLEVLDNLIKDNKGISCVCFMGGDSKPHIILSLARFIRVHYPELKIAWYSGKERIADCIVVDLYNFDYIKVGPYIEELGPLTSKTTNQRMYEIHPRDIVPMLDITNLFWKK